MAEKFSITAIGVVAILVGLSWVPKSPSAWDDQVCEYVWREIPGEGLLSGVSVWKWGDAWCNFGASYCPDDPPYHGSFDGERVYMACVRDDSPYEDAGEPEETLDPPGGNAPP